ncbi:hypothetical protein [Pseudomonas piscis]|uniref:hypothetical protein n=1 Tax=Pseudomonas piscis TaxID=2614538 RepID=UPI0021D59C18|nr:hypothetical protein [Pseudomonas piscis]MCU7647106.1 hypothetical protein [Pseudomonas piscis]
MELEYFLAELEQQHSSEELLDFCRKHVLHGIPHVFHDRVNEYYDFKKLLTKKFSVAFHEIYITGSGKLGFSPHKRTIFDYNSDIDVALISPSLFDKIMLEISYYQMNIRNNRAVVRDRELSMYHEFLEYSALGWIRPDKLPISFQMKTLKKDWFDFFDSISNNKSSVGNYKVAAGVFKSYDHFERYTVSGFENLSKKRILEKK